jgi:hypothetical protein
MDIVFHPVVYYFSGYSPNDGTRSQLQSGYLHWHYETFIDRRFNGGVFLERIVMPGVVKELILPPIQHVARQNVIDSLKKQISYFRLIHSRLYYRLYKMLAKIGLVDKRLVAGFYANLSFEMMKLPEKLNYRDIISGEDRETTLDGLMDEGIRMAVMMIEAAYEYDAGNISKETCKGTIAGNNLDTGRLNKTKEDIRFSVKSERDFTGVSTTPTPDRTKPR